MGKDDRKNLARSQTERKKRAFVYGKERAIDKQTDYLASLIRDEKSEWCNLRYDKSTGHLNSPDKLKRFEELDKKYNKIYK